VHRRVGRNGCEHRDKLAVEPFIGRMLRRLNATQIARSARGASTGVTSSMDAKVQRVDAQIIEVGTAWLE